MACVIEQQIDAMMQRIDALYLHGDVSPADATRMILRDLLAAGGICPQEEPELQGPARGAIDAVRLSASESTGAFEHAATLLAKEVNDEYLDAIRADWGNTNAAVLRHWRDEVLRLLPGGIRPEGARGWHSIELAPTTGESVIVAFPQRSGVWWVGEAYYATDAERWFAMNNDPMDSWGGPINPTVFQWLPAPPASAQE